MRILVLDDNDENVEILADTLRSEGHDVEEYTSPNEAMKCFHGGDFGVVISDIKMPEMDGLEVLEMVKQHNPDTYVILVTGFACMENSIDALNKGAYRFFRKPLDIREIISALRDIEIEMKRKRNAQLRISRD